MGRQTFSLTDYHAASERYVPKSGSATRSAEQHAKRTGKLNPLVDPAQYGVIRRSLPRFEQKESGLFELTIGTPMPVETRLDTTGSMGGNVDVALKVLPDAYALCGQALEGYDLQMAIGIFGDVVDEFVLCRPQFEMVADKIVEQLTLMVPERAGGDATEDPEYGLFGAAYLTGAYINRIGLKGYDFTVSDAPTREHLSEKQLTRIFGEEVFEKVAKNGHQIDRDDLPNTHEVVMDLQARAHAFFLQVDDRGYGDTRVHNQWSKFYGHERVVVLPSVELLPQVQAVIIGLTEGTLELDTVSDFLTNNNVSKNDAKRITDSVANVPIGAQVALEHYDRRPMKGDLFKEKTDLWPIDPAEAPNTEPTASTESGPNWL